MSKVNIPRTVMLIPAELTCSHFCTHVIKAPKEWDPSVCDLAYGEGERQMSTVRCRERVLGSITWGALPASALWGNSRSTEHSKNADFLQPTEDIWILPAALYIQFIPFQSQTEKSQTDLQFVYKQATNQALGSLHFSWTSSQVKQEVGAPHDGLDRNPLW